MSHPQHERSFNPRSPRSRGATASNSSESYLPGNGFNPRSPRSRGATTQHPTRSTRESFNPRSPRSRGATAGRHALNAREPFQPTLPAFTGSDGNPFIAAAKFKGFQPTLPAFTGSDRGHPRRGAGGRVSTHAPRVHGERHHPHVGAEHLLVSTHAPRVHGERRPSSLQPAPGPVSTHAPRVHGERHGNAGVNDFHEAVSTHAPRVHGERPCTCWPSGAAACMFQPTLPAFTGSDRCCQPGPSPTRCFNPRSPRSRGATRRRVHLLGDGGFQPTLPAFTGSDFTAALSSLLSPWFQPTLPAFTGSDVRVKDVGHGGTVSTHAPRVHGERPHLGYPPKEPHTVSTHAPRVHGERLLRRSP